MTITDRVRRALGLRRKPKPFVHRTDLIIDLRGQRGHGHWYFARQTWERLFRIVHAEDFRELNSFLVDLRLFEEHWDKCICEPVPFWWVWDDYGSTRFYETERDAAFDLAYERHKNCFKVTLTNDAIIIEPYKPEYPSDGEEEGG